MRKRAKAFSDRSTCSLKRTLGARSSHAYVILAPRGSSESGASDVRFGRRNSVVVVDDVGHHNPGDSPASSSSSSDRFTSVVVAPSDRHSTFDQSPGMSANSASDAIPYIALCVYSRRIVKTKRRKHMCTKSLTGWAKKVGPQTYDHNSVKF